MHMAENRGVAQDTEGFKYAYELPWEEGASLLCEGVISSIVNSGSRQIFDMYHPQLGVLRIILGVVGDATIMCVDCCAVMSPVEQNGGCGARFNAVIIPFPRAAQG